MDLSVIAFLGLLLAVALLRLVELRISKRHQKEMAARGGGKSMSRIRGVHTPSLLVAIE